MDNKITTKALYQNLKRLAEDKELHPDIKEIAIEKLVEDYTEMLEKEGAFKKLLRKLLG